MKNLFKLLGLALIVAIAVPAAKAERLPMNVDKMPSQVQLMLNEYYPGVKVAKSWAKMMRPTTKPMWYNVVLDNGIKIKFSLDGNWEAISAKKSASTPVSIDFLPNEARKYISTKYPNETIKSIKFKKDFYKVKLSNGAKLNFDKEYQFVAK